MNFKKLAAIIPALLFVGAFLLPFSGSLFSQNSSNNSSSSNSNDDDSDLNSNYSGVRIDAQNVLRRDMTLDYGRVSRQQIAAAKASATRNLSQNVLKKSPIRYVSLTRLEKTIVDTQGVVTDEMKCLAGLQRIKYVFFFPETKDIVIAGPAEGWFSGYEGAMIGLTSEMPVCELQDLVTALRAYPPGNEGADVVGCSIDPTEEGNARLQQFIKSFGNPDPKNPAVRQAFVNGLRNSLGMQEIRVDGISPKTHAAHIMVAADYRMKRIGIGVEDVPAGLRIDSFISKAKPGGTNALYRWFFVPDYQSVILTEDRTGMELIGSGVKLVAEDEVVTATGERVVKKGKVDRASKAFSQSFTAEYPKLAQRSLVFAQLRNFVDMLVCAAHIQKEDFYGQAGWSMEFLGNEEKFAVESLSTPKQVEAVVGSAFRGGVFMAPIGGGVEIESKLALEPSNAKTEENGRISQVRNKIKIELESGQWWWD